MMIEDFEKGLELQDKCRAEVNRLAMELLEKWTATKAKQLREAVKTYESVKFALNSLS